MAIRYCIPTTLALLLALCRCLVAQPAETVSSPVMTATVDRALDGGAVRVKLDDKDQTVRLYGIWVPEDPRCVAFLEDRVRGRELAVEIMPQVCWENPTRPEVLLYPAGIALEGLSLNAAMLLNGFAVVRAPRCEAYSPVGADWQPLADEAQQAGRGLWPDGGVAFATYLRSQKGLTQLDILKALYSNFGVVGREGTTWGYDW